MTNGEQKLEMISQYGYYIDLFSSLKVYIIHALCINFIIINLSGSAK